MVSEQLLLKDPEIISMDGAEKKFGVTTEELSILISDGKLPAYILANASSKKKAGRLSKTVHRYAKITAISWIGESVDNGTALMMDESENIIIPNIITYLHGMLYKLILIKPNDLRSLVNVSVVAKKKKSTRDEFKVPAFNKFVEAYNSTIASGKKPSGINVLRELLNMSFHDDNLTSNPGKKKFVYQDVEIGYSTYKHWLTDLNGKPL
jgi:hypothetical protein